jgi:hypothetical protein
MIAWIEKIHTLIDSLDGKYADYYFHQLHDAW